MRVPLATIPVAAMFALALAPMPAAGDVQVQYVTVGDPGNPDDTHGPGYGGVDYIYRIGKYEVTNAQYSEFLNAVASVGDPYELYNADMGGGWNDIGGIGRIGSGSEEDPWVYSARADRGDRPVNYVNFWDACRFANWLHNGQPVGGQDLTTTEDGAYFLHGAAEPVNASIIREPDAQVWVPSLDEWYKAAYYDPDKPGGAGYWDFPTCSDTTPTAERPTGRDIEHGSANYYYGGYVDTTYYTTEVGAYTAKPSTGPYGTFDQGGNVAEWNEAMPYSSLRGVRGTSFASGNCWLEASNRNDHTPTSETYYLGFRVGAAYVPGDLDGDGLVTGTDIDVLNRLLVSVDASYDVDGDGIVSQGDVDELVHSVFGTTYGDVDLNGQVDFRDYLALKANLGTKGRPGWEGGDFNGDGRVDESDFRALQAGAVGPSDGARLGLASYVQLNAVGAHVRGDVNGDGALTAADIDALYQRIFSTKALYDINADSMVDQDDVSALVHTILCTEYGDTDLNGRLDYHDYLTLKANLGAEGELGWQQGDLNGDGRVDRYDIAALETGILLRPWGPSEDLMSTDVLPEPAALALLAVGGLALAGRRRRWSPRRGQPPVARTTRLRARVRTEQRHRSEGEGDIGNRCTPTV